jgi:hypothetical protein
VTTLGSLPRPVARTASAHDPTVKSRNTLFLNNDEAADYPRLSPRTLEKWRALGYGPHFRKLGGRIVYGLADLEARANSRICESTFDPNHHEPR